tara:strand:+ start:555 stop:1154 length:600 start_codon:yes stop_codon:yes gene_type:complete
MYSLHKESEEHLVEQLTHHNEAAFRQLYDTYRNDIYAYSISMLKDKVIAEGVVQDVFMKVWLNREHLDHTLSFKAYVFRLTRNITINLLKRAVREKQLKEVIFYSKKSINSPSAEYEMVEKEYNVIRKQIIDKLPPRRRLIFKMSRNEGLSYEEISLKLGISENTVKSQMNKALQAIRVVLSNHSDVIYILIFISIEIL